MTDKEIFRLIRSANSIDILKWLSVNHDLTAKNESGDNLLHCAISYDRPDVALALIEKGIEINSKNDQGKTPLHYALEGNMSEVVKSLLRNPHIDVNSKDNHGNSPLWVAVFNARGNYELVDELLEKKALPESKNIYGKTPLSFAEQIQDIEMVKKLKTY